MQIVALTGAGISAESGLGTFRDEDGLWARYRIEDVATPQAYVRDPALVHNFYNMRRAEAAKAAPNAAHKALAALQSDPAHDLFLVTQNVDGLHEAAGATTLHMHGALDRAKCATCDHRWPAALTMHSDDPCPNCSAPTTRPDIVWFGEYPEGLDQIDQALQQADLFVAIGTSGEVYPAAGFVAEAARLGIPTLEMNLAPSAGTALFDEVRLGPATEIVPAWVAEFT